MESPKFVVEPGLALCVCIPEPGVLSPVPACEPVPEGPVLPVEPVDPASPAEFVALVEPVLEEGLVLVGPVLALGDPDDGVIAAETAGMMRIPDPQPISVARTHTTIIEEKISCSAVANDLPCRSNMPPPLENR
jgi:hypothetical protein